MRSLFAALSKDGLASVCKALSQEFSLPPFRAVRQSDYLATADSYAATFGFTVTEYFGFVALSEAERLGPPDYSNLTWRETIGEEFNFQVAFDRDPALVSRQKARRIKQRLRPVFDAIRLHGDAYTAFNT